MIRRRKKEVKRTIVASIIMISMLLVTVQLFSNFSLDVNNKQEQNWLNNENDVKNSNVDPYLTDYYITGSGSNQDVRIYALNSSASNNNQVSFDIPSMSTTDTTYLTYGNFNFTFQNNFTTDYLIEDTDALYANDFIKFVYNEDTSSMDIDTGVNLDAINFNNLVDDNPSTYIRLNASSGVLNFTISSNFASTIYDGALFDLTFDRTLILGLISKFSGSLTNDAYLTLKM
ncbi:MAG: hypothetical protein ACFFCG_04955, partial [Promethearchaeota archaeon]